MRPMIFEYGLVDTDGIFAVLTDAGPSLPLTGALTVNGVAYLKGFNSALEQYRVSFTSANDNSAINLTVNGFDSSRRAISETLQGPGAAATVLTDLSFAEVTSITTDGATDALDAGVSGVGATGPIPLNLNVTPFNVSIFVYPNGSNVTVQYTGDQIFDPELTEDEIVWFDHANLTAITTDENGTLISPVTAIRYVLNTYVAPIEGRVEQAGI